MIERNQQNNGLKSAKTVLSGGKVMAIVIWDASGIIFIDYIQNGNIINSEWYVNLFEHLSERKKKKKHI
jgi:uncharacterized protein YuzE